MEKQTTEPDLQDAEAASVSIGLEALQAMQREVQRKFGRAVLILQQYERLRQSCVIWPNGSFGAFPFAEPEFGWQAAIRNPCKHWL